MLNILASHNDDIKRLIEKGFAVGIDSNYLVIRDIPYLNQNKQLQWGALVSKLVFTDANRVSLHDHQVLFCGSHPFQIDGKQISNLAGGPTRLVLASTDLVVERSFSNKPAAGFRDLYEKIESYVTVISGPAMQLYDVHPYTYRTSEEVLDSVFKVRDTLTSRAEIGDLAKLFSNEIVALIGLGGTGAYTLDFLAKTPVKEIRGFDGDWYHAHTSFRSPGALRAEGDDKELGQRKAVVYQKRYETFRHGIHMHTKYILADSNDDLQGVTFAFICIDKGEARHDIIKLLTRLKIPFIDVGMGLDRQPGTISGTVRTTYFPVGETEIILDKKLVPVTDIPDDVYRNNIQIAELNALNACFAVIRYKQLRGFYANDNNLCQMLFTLDSLQLLKE